MAVLIGSARINELGQKEGGQKGDQNKKEVCTEPWYLHDKGWYVIRAKSPTVRKKIAQDMRYACDNDMIGYSYWSTCYTLYNEVAKYNWDCSKVKIPCDTNCAKLVLVCAKYAGTKINDFYTGNEVEMFKATGQFDILTDDKYCRSSDYLLEGDILVTREQGHTVVVLSDGENTKVGTPFMTANCRSVNMRDGWTTDDKVIDTLGSHVRVDLFGWSPTGWGYVEYNGKMGYISNLYLQELDKAVCKGGSTYLRDKAGRNIGKVILSIPAGSTVHITGKTTMVGSTKWYEVIFKGYTGWASSLYIKPQG